MIKQLYPWRYFIIIIGVYLGWKLYRIIYYKVEFLVTAGDKVNRFIADSYLTSLAFIAGLFNETYTTGEILAERIPYPFIQLQGTDGIYLGWPCLGITGMVVFIGTILLLRGQLKKKLLYILGGILVIFIVNSIRMAALMFMDKYSTEHFFMFHHAYSFVVFIYSVVFVLIFIYLRKLEPPPPKKIYNSG